MHGTGTVTFLFSGALLAHNPHMNIPQCSNPLFKSTCWLGGQEDHGVEKPMFVKIEITPPRLGMPKYTRYSFTVNF